MLRSEAEWIAVRLSFRSLKAHATGRQPECTVTGLSGVELAGRWLEVKKRMYQMGVLGRYATCTASSLDRARRRNSYPTGIMLYPFNIAIAIHSLIAHYLHQAVYIKSSGWILSQPPTSCPSSSSNTFQLLPSHSPDMPAPDILTFRLDKDNNKLCYVVPPQTLEVTFLVLCPRHPARLTSFNPSLRTAFA